MSDRELRDQLMTLLLAGHETTATALAWAFELLFRHPDALERLRDEVEPARRRAYLDAVIEEALRLRPVVPFVGRELRQPMTLDGHELPAGTTSSPPSTSRTRTRRPSPSPTRSGPSASSTATDRDLQLDPVRRRHPALHRRRLRAVRDAGRAERPCLRAVELAPAAELPERMVRRNVTLSPRTDARRGRVAGAGTRSAA